jgi:hypothetical protein
MPNFREYMRRIEAIFDPTRPETLLDGADTLTELVSTGALTAHFNETLHFDSGLLDENSFLSNGTVFLYKGEYFALAMEMLSQNTKYLYYQPSHSITVVINDGEIDVRRFKLDPVPGAGGITKATVLREAEGRIIRRGEPWCRDGRTDVDDVVLPTPTPVPVVRLVSLSVGKLEWAFERDTLRPWNAMAVHHEGTYLASLINLLGTLRNGSSLVPLQEAADQAAEHYVRWAAVKSLGRIDRSAAIAALRGRLQDPHPEVRQAATRTLARYDTAAAAA